jgi:hypothetical protein
MDVSYCAVGHESAALRKIASQGALPATNVRRPS